MNLLPGNLMMVMVMNFELVTQPDGVARPDSSLTVPPEVEYLPSKSKTFGNLKISKALQGACLDSL